MKNLMIAAAVAFFAVGTAATASTIQPNADDGGDMPGGLARGVASDAYDGDDTTFFELEFGETVEFYFAPEFFSTPGGVLEITSGGDSGRAAWDEYISIEVGVQGDPASFVAVVPAVIQNLSGEQVFTFATAPAFNVLRVTDVTLAHADFTQNSIATRIAGFDIAEISVSAVPLPAGVLLLASALGGLGLARRRRKAA